MKTDTIGNPTRVLEAVMCIAASTSNKVSVFTDWVISHVILILGVNVFSTGAPILMALLKSKILFTEIFLFIMGCMMAKDMEFSSIIHSKVSSTSVMKIRQ